MKTLNIKIKQAIDILKEIFQSMRHSIKMELKDLKYISTDYETLTYTTTLLCLTRKVLYQVGT